MLQAAADRAARHHVRVQSSARHCSPFFAEAVDEATAAVLVQGELADDRRVVGVVRVPLRERVLRTRCTPRCRSSAPACRRRRARLARRPSSARRNRCRSQRALVKVAEDRRHAQDAFAVAHLARSFASCTESGFGLAIGRAAVAVLALPSSQSSFEHQPVAARRRAAARVRSSARSDRSRSNRRTARALPSSQPSMPSLAAVTALSSAVHALGCAVALVAELDLAARRAAVAVVAVAVVARLGRGHDAVAAARDQPAGLARRLTRVAGLDRGGSRRCSRRRPSCCRRRRLRRACARRCRSRAGCVAASRLVA